MNIGQAAQATEVSAKMIRYYESIELIQQSKRSDAGYRKYGQADLHALRFIKRARNLGFSLLQIRGLLSLWGDANRASADVKAMSLEHVKDLNKRIDELTTMRDNLMLLLEECSGDDQPGCPLLEELGPRASSCCQI